VVGTPIGNLGDLSPRAREALATADLVAAEDTRRTRALLSYLGLRKPLLSYFSGNERARTARILRELEAGRCVALVSEAGMPGISDPGEALVRACVERGLPVEVVPGPSALLIALVASGLPSSRFCFEGFLPRRPKERRKRLEALAREERTVVIYESPRRVRALLADALDIMGDRRVAVARELTKVHEEVIRGRISEVLPRLPQEVRGEVTVVLEGAGREAGPA
jgi:16S rRNA (cytidine1402-2'-O)-methyltransferase